MLHFSRSRSSLFDGQSPPYPPRHPQIQSENHASNEGKTAGKLPRCNSYPQLQMLSNLLSKISFFTIFYYFGFVYVYVGFSLK